MPFSTCHLTTWEGELWVIPVSSLSFTLHIHTETMPYSFYLLHLSLTSPFLFDSTVSVLAQTSLLTLIMLMPPKWSPYFHHCPVQPLSKRLSDWSFQKVLLSCPCFRSSKGSPGIQDHSPHFLAGHRRPSIFWIFSSLVSHHFPIGICWSNNMAQLQFSKHLLH